jgi:hypothetical protein
MRVPLTIGYDAARAELAKNASPVDFTASFDSLQVMESVMRHFYLRALIEQRIGPKADWSVVNALMLKTLAAAEKVARYRVFGEDDLGSPPFGSGRLHDRHAEAWGPCPSGHAPPLHCQFPAACGL